MGNTHPSSFRKKYGIQDLGDAIERNKISKVKKIIKQKDVDLNSVVYVSLSGHDMTPLLLAIYYDYGEIFDMLINAKVNLNFFAEEQDPIDTLEALSVSDKNKTMKRFKSFYEEVIELNNIFNDSSEEELVGNIKKFIDNKKSAKHLSAIFNSTIVVDDIASQDNNNIAQIAVLRGRMDLLELLRTHNLVDDEYRNEDGRTVLNLIKLSKDSKKSKDKKGEIDKSELSKFKIPEESLIKFDKYLKKKEEIPPFFLDDNLEEQEKVENRQEKNHESLMPKGCNPGSDHGPSPMLTAILKSEPLKPESKSRDGKQSS